ncbi:MAG: cell division protein SepF [Capsulimonadaceae bacterium]
MQNQAEAEDFESPRKRGFLGFFRSFTGNDEWEEEEDDIHDRTAPAPSTGTRTGGTVTPLRRPATVPSAALRLDHGRRAHVMVRRSVQNFDDARRSADGLKEGEPQIVNLENTPSDMAERIIDFLNGATYALDGSVEKIGEQVYLFTPSSITIDVEDKRSTSARASFLDRA